MAGARTSPRQRGDRDGGGDICSVVSVCQLLAVRTLITQTPAGVHRDPAWTPHRQGFGATGNNCHEWKETSLVRGPRVIWTHPTYLQGDVTGGDLRNGGLMLLLLYLLYCHS